MNTAMVVGTDQLTGQPGRFQPLPPAQAPTVRLLQADGSLAEDPDFAPLLTAEEAAELFRDMTLIRRFDTESTALQRKGQLGLWAPLLGQEAIQAGVCAALGRHDHVFPSHREHGLAMLMGLPIERILGIYTGQETGDWDAEENHFHHFNMVIGGHTLHGVGYAMAQARDRQADSGADDGVSLIIHGDGAISEGDVNEAYIFAAAYQAPAVFLCVNNQWAISEPVSRQSTVPLYQRAWGFGIPSVQVDGNDVLGVHATVAWALERARSGQGPTFIEAFTYRMGAHTTSDDPSKYRDKDEAAQWQLKDPMSRTETWLRAQGAWDDARQAGLDQEAEAFGDQIRSAVGHLSTPKFDEIFDRVYARPTPDLVAQREQAADEAVAL